MYYNLTAATKWQCLFAPDFRNAFTAMNGSAPAATNVYFEILEGATYANGLARLIVGTGYTAGTSIDSAKYAGGFGQVQGKSVTGSGVVTVTGTWRKTDGTTDTGDGTATVSAGESTVVLTPPFTDALLISVSTISADVEITAGTLYAEAKAPSGRTNPPT